MTKRIALGVLLLAGCSKGPTTKPGPLGEMDLAAKLPSGVTVPADVKSFEAPHKLCSADENEQPIEVRVRWKAFKKEDASYVSMMATSVPLKCAASARSKRVSFGNPAIHIRADGVSSTTPVW